MRILHITSELPYPVDRGAPLRTFHLLRCLARENDIDLLTLTSKGAQDREEATTALAEICRTVRAFPKPTSSALGQPLRAFAFGLRRIPIELRAFASPAMAGAIEVALAREVDVIGIEHPSMMPYLRSVPVSLRRRTVGLSHDVDFSKFERIARLEPGMVRRARLGLHSRMMRRWEPAFAGRFAHYTTVSEADRQRLLRENRHLAISVIPNGVDVPAYPVLPEPPRSAPLRVLFLGNLGYRPNIDAVTWLAEAILPEVWRAGIDVSLDVVGVNVNPAITRLASPRIRIVGAVPDVRPYYADAHLSVVPLRAGGGTRLKILEAMALGRPVVSTTIGCEGLEVEPDVHLLVADDAQKFARAVAELLGDPPRRHVLARNARARIEQRYDWCAITEILTGVYADVLARSSEAPARIGRGKHARA